MNPDDIIRLLDELGERLGPAGQRVFELAVRQVYVEAITVLAALAILIAVGLVFGPRLARWSEGGGAYSDRPLLAIFVWLGYGGLLVGAVLLVMLVAVPGIFNPEYAALSRLLGAIR